MPTNYLTQFATSGSANLPVESTWQNLTERATGFQTGLARSSYFNRLFAQGANAAYVLGQLVVDYASQDANLNGATLYTNFKTALNSYVGGSFLPLSGGTMTGVIFRNGAAIQSNTKTGVVSLQNGTGADGGGGIWLYGASHASNPGKARLQAYDSTNQLYCAFDANGDGTLTWANKHLAFGVKTFTVTKVTVPGFVTGSSTTLTLVFPFVIAGTSVSVSALTASVRVGTGGYTTPGGSTAESLLPAGVTITTYISESDLRVELVKSSGWGATNNTTVCAAVSSITFTVS